MLAKLQTHLRTLYFRFQFRHFGSRSRLYGPFLKLIQPQNITIGSDVHLGRHLYLCASLGSHITISDNVQLMHEVILYAHDHSQIQIGHHTYINHHTELTVSRGHITIGTHVLIGMHVLIVASTYPIDHIAGEIINQQVTTQDITIGDGAWIGARAIILPGVTIGKGAVIGAGSIVTQDIPEYSVALGSPARVIRQRKL